MCGRYSLYESMTYYLKQLDLELEVINGYDDQRINRYNVAPTTRVEIIRPVEERISVERVRWGWAPAWARGGRPDRILARSDTLTEGKYWRSLWPGGRAIAPANGWFEWVPSATDPKRKQPYYIKAASGEALFFAAVAQVHPGDEPDERDGFVIVTAEADEGLIDIHDRKPLVLTAEVAREWLDPATPIERMTEIARTGCRPAADFTWHPVDRAVGNVKNQGAALIEPLEELGGDLFG